MYYSPVSHCRFTQLFPFLSVSMLLGSSTCVVLCSLLFHVGNWYVHGCTIPHTCMCLFFIQPMAMDARNCIQSCMCVSHSLVSYRRFTQSVSACSWAHPRVLVDLVFRQLFQVSIRHVHRHLHISNTFHRHHVCIRSVIRLYCLTCCISIYGA